MRGDCEGEGGMALFLAVFLVCCDVCVAALVNRTQVISCTCYFGCCFGLFDSVG